MTKHTGAGQTDKIVRFLQEAFANGWTGVSFDNCVDSGVTLADLIEETFLSSSAGSEQIRNGWCEVCERGTLVSGLVLGGII